MPICDTLGVRGSPVDCAAVQDTELLRKIDDHVGELVRYILLGITCRRDRGGCEDKMRSGDGMRLHQVE